MKNFIINIFGEGRFKVENLKEKLTILIYLNTKIVLDMLATIEDGFSTVKNIQTSHNKTEDLDAEANIGTRNKFSLFNIGLNGRYQTENKLLRKKHIRRCHCFRS